MISLFLDTVPATSVAGMGALLGILAAFAIFALLITIAVYIYMSFAFMAIARKAGYPSPGIAWIPLIGPALILSRTAKMHWWPILLIIGFFIPFINWICALVFFVFWIIWLWKTFEALGRPGWWAILSIINILMLIFIGIAAWGNGGKTAAVAKRK